MKRHGINENTIYANDGKLNLRFICSEFKDKIKKIFSKEKIQSNEKNELQ